MVISYTISYSLLCKGEKLMENLYALIDKILPMLSTILGAYITYYVTVSSKKNEAKVNAQIRARDEYWIPAP